MCGFHLSLRLAYGEPPPSSEGGKGFYPMLVRNRRASISSRLLRQLSQIHGVIVGADSISARFHGCRKPAAEL